VVVPFVQAAVTTAFPASLGSSALLRPIYQLVEGWNAVDLIGKQVTVSFVASATVVGRYAVVIRDGNTTPANVQACVKTFDITAANTRQAFDITFPAIPSNAVIPQSSATGFFLSFGAVAGSSLNVPTKDVWVQGNYESSSDVTNWATTVGNSLNITKVRLTDGIKPAPQEWRPYGLELALCQRYYIAGAHNFRGYELAGTNVIQTLSLPVSMRASPTLAWTTNPTVSSNVGIPTLGVLNVFQISFTGAVSTTGDCYWINGIWAANAEL
jgi:hypothetical protein